MGTAEEKKRQKAAQFFELGNPPTEWITVALQSHHNITIPLIKPLYNHVLIIPLIKPLHNPYITLRNHSILVVLAWLRFRRKYFCGAQFMGSKAAQKEARRATEEVAGAAENEMCDDMMVNTRWLLMVNVVNHASL